MYGGYIYIVIWEICEKVIAGQMALIRIKSSVKKNS